jgi:hypothetical protein
MFGGDYWSRPRPYMDCSAWVDGRISCTVFVLICTLVVLNCFVIVCVCVCGFCNVCVCVS